MLDTKDMLDTDDKILNADYREDNKWTVYVHIVPKSISNYEHDKYYVGVTSRDVNERWHGGSNYRGQVFYNAVKKYTWDNIMHEIIAENLTKKEAFEFERTLIKELKSNDKTHGYNISEGGEGGNRAKTYPVKQYDLLGNFIKEYDSAAEAARQVGTDRTHITHACKKHWKAAGYMWCYATEEITEPYRRKGQRTVIQKTLDGEYVATYISLTDAAQKTGIGRDNIHKCIKGKNSYAGGYLWFYE